MEWFKKLSVEERVNSLSTVCPHLTEILIQMNQRLDSNGITLFARQGSQQQQENQYHSSYHPHSLAAQGYPPYGHLFTHQEMPPAQTASGSLSFKDLFYSRNCGEAEKNEMISSEKGRISAEQEILRQVRLTDYYQQLDTLTISADIVESPEFFFKLMQIATNNQAFSRECHFEMKPAGVLSGGYMLQIPTPVIEQPAWFKPRSFHTFATWVLVALEENLWAHYIIDNNIYSPGHGAKTSDLSSLFREKSDCCTLDVESSLLSNYWKELGEKEKKSQIEILKQSVIKEFGERESQSGGGISSIRNQQKVVHSKGISYSLQFKDKSDKTPQHYDSEIRDVFLVSLIDLSLKPNCEEKFILDLIYSTFECSHNQRHVGISRKFLDLIKRKYKDDLMENLLQEEQLQNGSQNSQGSKTVKKKKKKANKQAEIQPSSSQHNIKALESEEKDDAPIQTQENTKQASTLKKTKALTNESQPPQTSSNISTSQSTPKQQSQANKQPKKKKSKKAPVEAVTEDRSKVQMATQPELKQIRFNMEESNSLTILELDKEEQSVINQNNIQVLYQERDQSESQSMIGDYNKHIINQKKSDYLQLESDQIMATNPASNQKPQSENGTPELYTAKATVQSDVQRHLSPMKDELYNEPQANSFLKRDRYQVKSSSSSNSNSVQNDLKNLSSHSSANQEGPNSRGNSLQEREDLRLYLVELTNMMINEVCKKAETASPSPIRANQEEECTLQLQSLPGQAFESLAGDNSGEKTQASLARQQLKESQGAPRKYSSSDPIAKQGVSQQRRGFGINLKTSTISTDDKLHIGGKIKSQNSSKEVDISKKKPPQHVQNIQRNEIAESIEKSKADQISKRNSNLSLQKNDQQQNQSINATKNTTIQEQPQKKTQQFKVAISDIEAGEKSISNVSESNFDGSTIMKKKRNKKKPVKMTDTDIMNQFMKSLHSNPEEEKAPYTTQSNQNRKKQQTSQTQNISCGNNSSIEVTIQQSTQSKTIHNKAGFEFIKGQGSQKIRLGQGKPILDSNTDTIIDTADEKHQYDEKEEFSNVQSVFDNAKIKNRFAHGSSRNQINIAEEIVLQRHSSDSQSTNSNLIQRKYTEQELLSSQPLTHHRQQFNNGSNVNEQESTASHDGVKQRLNNKRNQGPGASRISNNTQRNRGIGGATKVFQKSNMDMQITNDDGSKQTEENGHKVESNQAIKSFAQTNLNSGSVPFKISTPFNTFAIPTQAKSIVNEGQSEDEASTSLQTKLVGEQQLQLTKHKSIQSTPAKVLSSTLQSGKSSRQLESNIPFFQNASLESSNVSVQGQDDSQGSHNQQSYRTPPQNSKKYGNQSQYFTNTQTAQSETQQVQIASTKKTNFTSSSAHSTHNQKQDVHSTFENNFASNFVPSSTGLQNTFGGVSYHPYAPHQPQNFSIETSESQNHAQQHAILPLQSPIFVPTPSMTPPLQFSNSTPAFHPTYGKRNQYQGNNGSQKQHNGPRNYNVVHNKQQWNNEGIHSARNLNSSSSSNSGNVHLQPMNISQSMHEQQQQLMSNFIANNNSTSYQNGDSPNIFLQDQNAFMNQQPYYDNLGQQRNLNHDQVFPYIEKTHSFNMGYLPTGSPMPCFSPQQQHGYLSAQYQNLGMTNNHPEISLQPQIGQQALYNYQRQNSILPPSVYQMSNGVQNPGSIIGGPTSPQFDQNQDLIFQIFNSIKSNHSMSPVPQSISPPAMLTEYQISQQPEILHPAYKAVTPESNFYYLLDKDIELYCQQVKDTMNNLKPERDFVIQRIQAFANKVFVGENPRLELFGSLVTGLALETSDMDLAVTGLRIDDRYQMIVDLKNLATTLEEWQVLESIKAIETASIPVIKLKVDLKILREMEMSEKDHGDFAQRPIPEDQRFLCVDITFDDTSVSSSTASNAMSPAEASGMFETKTHLGLQSCALVQRYIKEYKHLREVAILLKKFLAIHNFNSPYYGGLSSYSTVLIIVAYMNYYGLKESTSSNAMMINQYGMYYSQTQGYQVNSQAINELSPSRLLMGFLDFYGNIFNPKNMGISVVDDGSFFQNLVMESSNFMILDPLNLSNNTTKNSYLTRDILQMFQTSFNNLKALMFKLYNQQQQYLSLTPIQTFQYGAEMNQELLNQIPLQNQGSDCPSKKSSSQLISNDTASVGAVDNANEERNEQGRNLSGLLEVLQNQTLNKSEFAEIDLSQSIKCLQEPFRDQNQFNDDSARIQEESIINSDGNAGVCNNNNLISSNEQVVVELKGVATLVPEMLHEISGINEQTAIIQLEEQIRLTNAVEKVQEPTQLKQQLPCLEKRQEIPSLRVSILDVFFSKDGLMQEEIVAELLVSHYQRDSSERKETRNYKNTVTSDKSDDGQKSKDGNIHN